MTKQLKVTIATVLFLIVSITNIWAVMNHNDEIRTYTKPFIITFLVVVYLMAVKKPNLWFVLGLFLSFLGDVFLLSSSAEFFMYGLASFLFAHIMYIKITAGFLKKSSTSNIS